MYMDPTAAKVAVLLKHKPLPSNFWHIKSPNPDSNPLVTTLVARGRVVSICEYHNILFKFRVK